MTERRTAQRGIQGVGLTVTAEQAEAIIEVWTSLRGAMRDCGKSRPRFEDADLVGVDDSSWQVFEEAAFALMARQQQCLYHKCHKRFFPRRKSQTYCGATCRKAASSWNRHWKE